MDDERYTIRIQAIAIDDQGEETETCYSVRLDTASTDYGSVENFVDTLVGQAEDVFSLIADAATFSPRLPA